MTLIEKINNLSQQIQADYRTGEIDDRTYKMEIELENLLKKNNIQLNVHGLVIN